ncbi:hypothetical protein BGZ46_000270 [Entomortierella lignicola]|nr:hypothetical protein BGZ46_000270 [Entomortierella lignicola]
MLDDPIPIYLLTNITIAMYSNAIASMLIAVTLVAPSLVVALTAQGFVRSVQGGNKFTSTFIIDDIQYHFSGNLYPATQDFTSFNAVLEYESVAQLTAQRPFDGKVGTQDILFQISNGPIISGPLDYPIHPASRVSGAGTWAVNYIWAQDENLSQERPHCRAFLVQ